MLYICVVDSIMIRSNRHISRVAYTTHRLIRRKMTSREYVRKRPKDPSFEKLMAKYRSLLKVVAIENLILASPSPVSPSLPLEFLARISHNLRLGRRGPLAFLRKYPRIFDIFGDRSRPSCRLTDGAADIYRLEAEATHSAAPLVVGRLVRLLLMSVDRTLPLRAVFKVWRELGLPDDFEDSILRRNPNIFRLETGDEPNTHRLVLLDPTGPGYGPPSAVDGWRISECCRDDGGGDGAALRFGFKQMYPPGMRVGRKLKEKERAWQRLPYVGPYDRSEGCSGGWEKRAVGIVHEFLSLTVEKMVEVEKMCQFRRSFDLRLNIRDLVLDHPGMFYLTTKGARHTVFLREAYSRGSLIEPNPVYNARRKLLHLVVLGSHRMHPPHPEPLPCGAHV